MELTNTIYKHVHAGTDAAAVDEAIDTLLELLAPFAPHLAAEAYEPGTPSTCTCSRGRWRTPPI